MKMLAYGVLLALLSITGVGRADASPPAPGVYVAQAADWVATDDPLFSVEMPGKAVREESGGGTSYKVESKTGIYLVVIATLDAQSKSSTPLERAKNCIDIFAQRMGSPGQSTPMKVSGVDGYQGVFSSQAGTVTVRAVSDKEHLYIISAAGPDSEQTHIVRFLDSFKLK